MSEWVADETEGTGSSVCPECDGLFDALAVQFTRAGDPRLYCSQECADSTRPIVPTREDMALQIQQWLARGASDDDVLLAVTDVIELPDPPTELPRRQTEPSTPGQMLDQVLGPGGAERGWGSHVAPAADEWRADEPHLEPEPEAGQTHEGGGSVDWNGT